MPSCSYLDVFIPVSQDDVRKIILSSPTKSCSLDPWPTFLVKKHLDILIVPIIEIVNLSLSTCEFPEKFRTAVVAPLHKKPSLPRESFGNYGPVSGLSFISKVIECIVAKQLNKHIVNNCLQNIYRSAYKAGHSTETALLKIKMIYK